MPLLVCITDTHTQPFNGPLSGTTRVSRYQKGKTSLEFIEARDSEWQWHLLGHMQVCISLQTDNHASTPSLSFFTGRMPFLTLNQQRQSTEGITNYLHNRYKIYECYKTYLAMLRLELSQSPFRGGSSAGSQLIHGCFGPMNPRPCRHLGRLSRCAWVSASQHKHSFRTLLWE